MNNPPCHQAGNLTAPIYKGDYSFNTGHVKSMSIPDYSIVILSLVISIIIALVIYCRQTRSKTLEDYLLMDRTLSCIPASQSMLASFVSAISLIGLPKEAYSRSIMDLWMIIPILTATHFSVTTFVPVFYQLRITCVHEYLELRFNRTMRVLGYIYYFFISITYLSMVLFTLSLPVNAVTGMSKYQSIIAVTAVCIIYTAIGNTKAVVYTDLFQAAVMWVGLFIILVKANYVVGGFSNMIDSTKRTNRLTFNIFTLDPRNEYSFWPLYLGMFNFFTYHLGISYYTVHRCLSCRSLKDAKLTMRIATPCIFFFVAMSLLLGLYISTFYENCDPKRAKLIKDNLELSSFFVMDAMGDTVGFAGIYMALLLCATLSSASTCLNSTAVATLEDVFRLFSDDILEQKSALRLIRVITVAFGLVCIEGAALTAHYMGNIFMANQVISSLLSSSVLAVYVMGVFLPIINNEGAMCGLLFGTAFSTIAFFGAHEIEYAQDMKIITCISNCNSTIFPELNVDSGTTPSSTIAKEKYFLGLSLRYSSTMGVVVTLLVGILASWATGFQDPQKVNPVLIVPFLDEVFPFYYLPESFRRKFRFGINHEDKWNKWRFRQEQKEDLISLHTDLCSGEVSEPVRSILSGRDDPTKDLFGPTADAMYDPLRYLMKEGHPAVSEQFLYDAAQARGWASLQSSFICFDRPSKWSHRMSLRETEV